MEPLPRLCVNFHNPIVGAETWYPLIRIRSDTGTKEHANGLLWPEKRRGLGHQLEFNWSSSKLWMSSPHWGALSRLLCVSTLFSTCSVP